MSDARTLLLKKAKDFREGVTKFILCKHGRKWAIYDVDAQVYYYGRKKELEVRLVVLNNGGNI